MNQATPRAPWHLWAIGILTLLWNAIGAMSYTLTHLGQLEALGMTPDQIAYLDSFPAWANAVWAIGVWFCLLGSVLLLMRSRHAVTAFALSVIGLVGTAYFSYVVSDVPENMQSVPLDVMIWAITLGSLWYAARQRAAGVLR